MQMLLSLYVTFHRKINSAAIHFILYTECVKPHNYTFAFR